MQEADNRSPNEMPPKTSVILKSDAKSRHDRALESLRERLEAIIDDSRQISRLLPQAVALSAKSGGLSEPLTPAVEEALAISSRRGGRELVRALAPIMGRTLRRAFIEAIRDTVMRINYFCLCHLSFRGLRWRLEAYRRGVAFKEIVVEHTLTTPVKQVFLIHRETGVLLQQAQSEIAGMRDWDMVSGMLTALQDFVHDSFNVAKSERLDTIRVGRYTVMIEHGEFASLAGVLQGDATDELRERFREVLLKVHEAFPDPLGEFEGDPAVFDDAHPFLQRCLMLLVSRERIPVLPQTLLILIIPLLIFAYWGVMAARDHLRWNAYLDRLNHASGIVVVDAGRENGHYMIAGFRDPSAENPYKLAVEMGLEDMKIEARWEPYQGLNASTMISRAREMLDPPDTVSFEVDEGTLVLWGTASTEWIEHAQRLLNGWTGALAYNMDRLIATDLDSERKWDAYLKLLARQPGIVVIEEGFRDKKRFVRGMRDPLAADPERLLGRFGIAPDEVSSRWERYVAVHPSLALRRSKLMLRPPEGVSLDLRGGILFLSGEAPHDWIREAVVLARVVPGVDSVDTGQLSDRDLQEFRALRAEIESMIFRFLVGSPDLWPGQGAKMTLFTHRCRKLRESAARCEVEFVIEIRGHISKTSPGENEVMTSETLSRDFYQMLQWQRADTRMFTTRGMGVEPPPGGFADTTAVRRIVSFSVISVGGPAGREQ